MPDFDRVVLIFNPHSSGQAEGRAEELRRDLARQVPALRVELLRNKQPSVASYAFTTVTPLPLQIDGEVLDLAPGTTVRVDIASKARQTIL